MNQIILEIVTVAAAGGAITGIIQLIRANYPEIPPKTVAIVLAGIIGCGLYLFGLLPEEMRENLGLAVASIWTTSVTIYEIFKNRK